MNVYTKTGDHGTTSLVGGTRVAKNDIRLDAYGTVDELNSWLGFILSLGIPEKQAADFVIYLQNRLFDLGAALATEADAKWQPKTITDDDIAAVEAEIDRMDEKLPRNNRFVLPGGTKVAAATNIARTVCRRAERIMVGMPDGTCPAQHNALVFVNRLSDYLFVAGRYCNFIAGQPETYWQ